MEWFSLACLFPESIDRIEAYVQPVLLLVGVGCLVALLFLT